MYKLYVSANEENAKINLCDSNIVIYGYWTKEYIENIIINSFEELPERTRKDLLEEVCNEIEDMDTFPDYDDIVDIISEYFPDDEKDEEDEEKEEDDE